MFAQVLLASALVALVASQVQPSQLKKCNAQDFQTCQHGFDGLINAGITADWSNPAALAIAIQNMYIKGALKGHQNGLIAVCNAYNVMLNCLIKKDLSPETCFDPLFMLKNDKQKEQAYPYAMVMKMLQFQCGAGFYPALDNWKCIQSVYQNKNATLEGALNNFLFNVAGNPMGACFYVKNGIIAYETAFASCHNTEVSYYACESFNQFTTPLVSACSETCRVAQQAQKKPELEEEKAAEEEQQ
ncbi:hypothetical protein L596_005966 [Steinernema carpocapsae]|uniref:SCP domain-containing protein n=1 Tax=Steinernema carpocapsae TaxID=34508 RepID=A0A4U8V1Z7_STECR|nr:hypothetical protein L596_005966 [Steinernema carpocapsae]